MLPTAHASATPGSAATQLAAISPGAHPMIDLTTRVNVVMVGYQSNAIDVSQILGQLPAQSEPVVIFPSFFGITQKVGLRYHYQYNVHFAGKAFDNAFFTHLATSGIVGGPEFFQRLYNQQVHRSLTVGPTVRYIDARSTEVWLEAQAASALRMDPSQYTVFLVNWYGRPDFQFHEFTNAGNPDPDTGFDPGSLVFANTRGWGGTSGRTWFYDLSAGPVWADISWNVDDADISGDGLPDYRIPSIWDYGAAGAYRPAADLSRDLGLVVRYVAIDELFTSSPDYDPAATVPASPNGSKQIAFDIFEGDPAASGAADFHPAITRQQHQFLEPYYDIKVGIAHDGPLAGGIQAAYDTWSNLDNAPGCWSAFGTPAAEMYCYLRDHRAQYFPAAGPDSIIPGVGFTVPDDAGSRLGYTGYSDNDQATGAPSYIELVDTPYVRNSIYASAYTINVMHEAGHFVGLAHPHDGWDSATGEIEPIGATAFVWAGDESGTVMSYLPSIHAFDIFNQDDMARWQVARLLDLADADAVGIVAAHNVVAAAQLAHADAEFHGALALLHSSQWVPAATLAVTAYRDVQRADSIAGLTPASVHAAAAAQSLLASQPPNAAARAALVKHTTCTGSTGSDMFAAFPVQDLAAAGAPMAMPHITSSAAFARTCRPT
jgi:hypothetical protein